LTAGLSDQQADALAAYWRLTETHPEMFGGRAQRPIVLDRDVVGAYAREHHVVLGVAAATPYLWLVNDLVRSSDTAGHPVMHPYLRIIAPPRLDNGPPMGAGSVILATLPPRRPDDSELIVLVQQERHATGTLELELPRGFAEPGVTAADQALRELEQETGYRSSEARLLGTTLTDSGTSDRTASFYHVPVNGQQPRTPETAEAITRTALLTREELWERIHTGTVRDAFTVQALALYERWVRMSS
jgi:ADP-ribose pyrophosphatase